MMELLKDIYGHLPPKLKRRHVIDWVLTALPMDLFQALDEVGKPVSERTQTIVLMAANMRAWFNAEIDSGEKMDFDIVLTPEQTEIFNELAGRLAEEIKTQKDFTPH